MKVVIVPHNSLWKGMFESEARQIENALGKNIIAIHHIGSTSIPNIYAKPIIDLLVEVGDLKEVDQMSDGMELLGYEVMGEFGISGRRYFRKDNEQGVRTHHVHVFQSGSLEIARHLAFRDYMVAHPAEANRYSDLKRQLAQEFSNDADAYMDGKDSFIKEIDRRAAKWSRTNHK